MRLLIYTAALAASVLAAGCVLGPNYTRPRVPVPGQWTVAPARGTSAKPTANEAWWSSFQDAELNSLIERASGQNLDLEVALERVQEARAARGIVKSGLAPSVETAASATRNRQRVIAPVAPGSIEFVPVEFNNFQGNVAASWELDVFGGIRRGLQAASADVAAAEENRRDVVVRVATLIDGRRQRGNHGSQWTAPSHPQVA